MPSAEGFRDISFLFQQLGDPTRLRILWLLCHCEECVCNLAAAVDMSAPAVSHHLRILKKSGIISSRRDGKEVYYSLADTLQAKLLHRSIDALFEISCPAEMQSNSPE
ncbi:metalloregulator ArsR/SmtB family transcription factor [Lacrimispora sp. 210928-DFI.3.58]|uniref:ArsR/SmtB family transcription factor n=1 Tax=Lacrimispora sp. 210928-DFI.3.58 TaxID=2883214 RepID=UPI002ED05E82